MISKQKDRTIMIDRLNIFEAIHAHQIVRRKLNPARAKCTLTPGPEAFPAALIHAMRDTKGETFERGKDGEFFWCRCQRPNVQGPSCNAFLIPTRIVPRSDSRIGGLNLGH